MTAAQRPAILDGNGELNFCPVKIPFFSFAPDPVFVFVSSGDGLGRSQPFVIGIERYLSSIIRAPLWAADNTLAPG